jgi:hypothetical protein
MGWSLKVHFHQPIFMTSALSRANSTRWLRASVLATYAFFAFFGLGLHHWSGSHRHVHGTSCSQEHRVEETQGDGHDHCCHAHGSFHEPERSVSKSSAGTSESIGSGASLCEGCEHWSSISQASQAWVIAQRISEDRVGELAVCRELSLFGDSLVAWHSRGPPVNG